MLTTNVGWSGDVTGSVAWQHNSDFNKILETVTGQTGTSLSVFGYDSDQLLTCASWTSCSGSSATSALRPTRDTQRGGLITSIALGNTTETFGYNTFGELARRTSAYSASPIADITYDAAGVERDRLGRIVQTTEVVPGVTRVYQYTYDALRRLTDVTVNGVLEEHFEYDANGNRTAGYKAGVGTWTGTYDDQDRLLTYGPWVFTFCGNG
jgi:YD repeat-containing protein